MRTEREIIWDLHKRWWGVIIPWATRRWLGRWTPEVTMCVRGPVWLQVRSKARKHCSFRTCCRIGTSILTDGTRHESAQKWMFFLAPLQFYKFLEQPSFFAYSFMVFKYASWNQCNRSQVQASLRRNLVEYSFIWLNVQRRKFVWKGS